MLTIALLLSVACGYRGPLYLPEDTPAEEQTVEQAGPEEEALPEEERDDEDDQD